MPTYTYKCNYCQAIVELEHRMSETRTDCMLCGHTNTLERYFAKESLPLTQFVGEWAGEYYKRNKGV